MDKRTTVLSQGNFAELLERCYENKEKVSMILDEGGLLRREGFIKSIQFNAQEPYFELMDGTKIDLQRVVAINGTFLSDYAEC